MLPQQYRLTRMKDFEILFKEGRFAAGNFVNAKVWKILPAKYPKRGYSVDDLKIGFVVGTKVAKSAVKRNRVKRQMREVVRLLLKDGKIRKGYMVAVMAKSNAVGAAYNEISDDVESVLRKARVLL